VVKEIMRNRNAKALYSCAALPQKSEITPLIHTGLQPGDQGVKRLVEPF
jgi:hypothetical protein